MFKRGHRRTARGGKTAEAKLRGRMWQSIYADLPCAQLNPDKRKAAHGAVRHLPAHRPTADPTVSPTGLGRLVWRAAVGFQPIDLATLWRCGDFGLLGGGRRPNRDTLMLRVTPPPEPDALSRS